MKITKLWFPGFILLMLMGAAVCLANPEADRLEDEAFYLIKNGNVDQGIARLKRAIEVDPENPAWHMNYGSVLFQIGRKMYQQGQKEPSKPLLKDSENELFAATRLFKRKDNLQLAQCYFLIGDLYSYVHEQKDIAKTYYQKSLEYHPQHEAALEAMKNLLNAAPVRNSPLPPASVPPKEEFKSVDNLILKNGEILKGNISESAADGVWFEIDQGAKVYFSNNEIKEIKKG